MKPGSKHSATSGRYTSASTSRVIVAMPATSSSAAASIARMVPNSTCSRSMFEPRNDTISTPAASEVR